MQGNLQVWKEKEEVDQCIAFETRKGAFFVSFQTMILWYFPLLQWILYGNPARTFYMWERVWGLILQDDIWKM